MIESAEEAYILGLWCADGYHRTSSIGLSNVDSELIKRFELYLRKHFALDRLRLRVYVPNHVAVDEKLIRRYKKVAYCKAKKARRVAYQVYVNSRPFLRKFIKDRSDRYLIQPDFIIPFMAGRFDGDGSVDTNLKKDFRIVYGDMQGAKIDAELLQRIRPYKVSIYHYKKARTYALYVSQKDSGKLIKDLLPYSLNLQKIVARSPVETYMVSLELSKS